MTIARQRKLSGSRRHRTVICNKSLLVPVAGRLQTANTNAEADANTQAVRLFSIVKLQRRLMQGADSSHNIEPKTDAIPPAVQPGECSRQS